MMFLQLAAIAMNENLSKDEFVQLSRQCLDNNLRLVDTMADEATRLHKEHGQDMALRYVLQCLPLIL